MAIADQTGTPQKSLFNRAMTAAIYISVVAIALNLVFYVTGLNEPMMTNTALKWLNNLILFGITFFFIHKAAQLRRDVDQEGYFSISNGMGLGTLTGLLAGVINAVWVLIFMGLIAPDLIDTIKEIATEQMMQSGQSEEQIEKAMEFSAFFFSPTFFAIVTVIFLTFLGFLAGIVSGLILKKERPLV